MKPDYWFSGSTETGCSHCEKETFKRQTMKKHKQLNMMKFFYKQMNCQIFKFCAFISQGGSIQVELHLKNLCCDPQNKITKC